MPLRFALLALLVVAPLAPAAAQTATPLYGITTCCPNRVVTFDPATGETADVVNVGDADDRFVATVGSGVYDPVSDRLFMVRNGTYIAADLATGDVTELFAADNFSQFAGFDTTRGVLYAFTLEAVEAGDDVVTYTNRLLAVDPNTGATSEVAVIGEGVSDGMGYEGDFFSSVSGPALLAPEPERLFTIRNSQLLTVALPEGTLSEQGDLSGSDLLAYAAERGALLTYVRDVPPSGFGEARYFVYAYDPATGEQTELAQVGAGVFEDVDGMRRYDGDVFTVSFGLAFLDLPNDRVFFNRNGTLIEVDLASGIVAERTALGNVRLVGAPPAVATDAAALPDAASLRADAYPNPFRDAARLTLTLDRPQHVEVAVYDLLGRRIAVLHRGPAPAGPFALDGVGRSLPAGSYVVRVQGERVQQSLRLTRIE